MGRFLINIAILLFVPLLLLAAVYFVTDPYKTLRPFSLTYFDSTNRDYLSSELFVKNYPEYRYDSYVFCSSRGGGINTYHWKKYLPEGSKPFLFQAWSETVEGVEKKVDYIDRHHGDIHNAIILIDIPGSFAKPQLPTKAMSIKDPRFSGQPQWVFQTMLLFNFVQKPSEWGRGVRHWLHPRRPAVAFDVVSNDWDKRNRDKDVDILPSQDSLQNLSRTARAAFFKNYVNNPDAVIPVPKSMIDDSMIESMKHIRELFRQHETDYRIIVTPGYCYQFPAISSQDLDVLKSIFGEDTVFDFSGRLDLTSDYNNFADPNHFGSRIGWQMIEEIYNPDYSKLVN